MPQTDGGFTQTSKSVAASLDRFAAGCLHKLCSRTLDVLEHVSLCSIDTPQSSKLVDLTIAPGTGAEDCYKSCVFVPS